MTVMRSTVRAKPVWAFLLLTVSGCAALWGQQHAVQSARFSVDTRDFMVTTHTSGSGTVARQPDKTIYVWGEQLTLTATATGGNRFDGWSGAASGTANPLVLTMTGIAVRAVTANFVLDVPAPGGLRASYNDFATRVEVDWDVVAGVDGYELRRGISEDGTGAVIIAELDVSFYDDRSANPGVVYYYWVRSVVGRDRSQYAGPVAGLRRDDSRPPAPAGLKTVQGLWPDRVQLDWLPVGLAQSYDIFRSVHAAEAAATMLATEWAHVQYFDHAPVGWTFYYWVSARMAGGITSPWAGPVRGRAGRSVTWWGAEILELEMPDSYADAIQIELGLRHGLALSPAGTVGAWGSNFFGQTAVPAGLDGVVAVAAGYHHSLALRGDGRVLGWGRDDAGQAGGGAGLRHLIAVSGGEAFSLGLDLRGRVHAWGANAHGQLAVPRHLPPAVAIAAGGAHALALLPDGTVVAWGDNSHGQASVPAGLRDVQAIAAGARHSLALLHDGTVRGWGDNSGGQAPAYWGGWMQTHGAGFQPMAGPSNVVSIAAGLYHSVVLLANGQVVTLSGGGGSAPAENAHIAALAAGDNYSAALRREGEPAAVWIVPAEVATPAGTGVILRALTLTTGSRTYQWKYRGTPLPGAQSAILRLRELRAEDAGEYTVEVGNEQSTLESEPVRVELAGQSPAVDYFTGYFALGDDWGLTQWFGRFYHAAFPWVYVRHRGWLWCAGWGGDTLLFYQPADPASGKTAHWLETTRQTHPHYYDYNAGNWIVFE